MRSGNTATPGTLRPGPSGIRIFIAVSLALHLPLFVYPVLRLCQWLEVGPLVTALVFVPVVLSQVVSRSLLRNAKRKSARALRHIADMILGISPIVLLLLICAEVAVASGLATPAIAARYVIGFALGVSLLGVCAALWPMVKTVTLSSDGLAEPLRFVQITDVHIGSRSSGFLARIVESVNRLEPAFLCITGDFIDASGVTVEELSPLGLLRCPVYFSIGNHERYEDLDAIVERLASLGVQVLRSESHYHRPDVQVLGIDDREDALQVSRELGTMTVDQQAFSLLMYHRPQGLEAAARAGVDLMISGHTHNGQIFPFNLVVARVFEQVVGLHRKDNTWLYVSQGTGTWGPVMRVGTRAEITLFEVNPAGQPVNAGE